MDNNDTKILLVPSSAAEGFFQKQPKLGNQYTDDPYFQRVLHRYMPSEIINNNCNNKNNNKSLDALLSLLGEKTVSAEVFENIANAEREKPFIEELQTFGGKKNALHTAEGWRASGRWAAEIGIPHVAYEDQYGSYSRVAMFALYYLYSPSSSLYTCPLAMTDAAATVMLLGMQEVDISPDKKEVFQDAYNHITSRDISKVWTSGQWMTERTGGSDVRNSETTASFVGRDGSIGNGGDWSISGHKWFSSATDSQMSIMLARTLKGGLSCFFAPLKTPKGDWNGVKIVRLKDKLGTRPLPTAELELKNMRGWLVGEEGRGIQNISTMLNYTRLYNAMSAISGLRRGLAIAKAFAKVREIQGKPLWKNSLHLSTLSKLEVAWRATMQLTFFSVTLLSLHENRSRVRYPLSSHLTDFPSSSADQTSQLLRVLTPLVKLFTAKVSIAGLAECMEALGGVGYLENEQELNIARLYRDANVLSIWEGTTNVLAVDTIRALKKGNGIVGLDAWVKNNLCQIDKLDSKTGPILTQKWSKIHEYIQETPVDDLIAQGRDISYGVVFVIVGILLAVDAMADNDEQAQEVLYRYVVEKQGMEGFSLFGFQSIGSRSSNMRGLSTAERSNLDCKLVFGHNLQSPAEAKL